MPNSVTVGAIASKRTLTLRLVDAEGGLKAFNFPLGITATNGQIQAFIDEYADATNANIYQADVTLQYGNGVALPSAAIDAPRVSVEDVVNVLFKPTDPLNAPIRLEILAPITAMINGKIVDPTNTELSETVFAFDVLLSLLGLGYTVTRYQFSERRKRNPVVRPTT